MKSSWSITKIYNIFSILIALVLLVSIVSLFYSYKIMQGLNEKFDKRYLSYQLADELRQSSDDLTRMARTYVVTGDPRYEQAYHDILAIRNGEKARPQEYNRIYWDLITTGNEEPKPGTDAIALETLMKEAGFSEEEFAKLQEAQNNSDDLVKTETLAMNAVKEYSRYESDSTFKATIDRDSAIAMMHNLDYHQYKYKVMKPIDEFFEILNNRTLHEVTEYQQKNKFMIFLMVTFPVVIFTLLILFYLTIRRRVLLPIAKLNDYSHTIAQGEFDKNIEVEHSDEIGNLFKAISRVAQGMEEKSLFVSEIGKGNFDIAFKPLSEKDNMGYALLQMSENLNKISIEEKKRNWVIEGLAQLGDILRGDQSNLEDMAYNVIVYMIKYIEANQGAMFIANDDNEEDVHLELLAMYAWGKKKYMKKGIEKGEGIAGTVWQEGELTYLTDIPEDYVQITSGLGKANPRSLLVVPLKLNEEVLGVIEIASFKEYEAYQIEFVKKLSENVASTISTSKINRRTKILLEQTQQQAEEMRAQEEEMRQNMEELSATQEEMKRKEQEYLQVIEELEGKNQ